MKDMDVTKFNDLGELIKFHRERKKISIDELSAKTKIRIKQLMSLEENNFQELPSRVYLWGFLKTLCNELEMDLEATRKFLEKTNLKKEVLVFLPMGKKIEPAEFKFVEKSSALNKTLLAALILSCSIILGMIVWARSMNLDDKININVALFEKKQMVQPDETKLPKESVVSKDVAASGEFSTTELKKVQEKKAPELVKLGLPQELVSPDLPIRL